MDKIAFKILELLSQNCRISTVEIAKRLRQPRHRISYYREQLHKKRVIINHELLLNFEPLGYTEYL
ncbi:MAG: Lrp/AsnC family transcriptional regulator, partial [Nanoarchaeota archaeon]